MTLNIPRRHSHMVLQQEVAGGNKRLEQPRDSAEGRWVARSGDVGARGVRGRQVEVVGGPALRLVSGTRPSRCLSYAVKSGQGGERERLQGSRVSRE